MSDYKGTGMVFVRTLMRQNGLKLEEGFLASLTPKQAHIYETTLVSSWISNQLATKVLEAAASICFPSDPKGLRRLGFDMASDNLRLIYRPLLYPATITNLIQQAPAIWNTYHRQGRASGWLDPEYNQAFLTVEDYPALPETLREVATGFVRGAANLTEVQDPQVLCHDNNPNAWRWELVWR